MQWGQSQGGARGLAVQAQESGTTEQAEAAAPESMTET